MRVHFSSVSFGNSFTKNFETLDEAFAFVRDHNNILGLRGSNSFEEEDDNPCEFIVVFPRTEEDKKYFHNSDVVIRIYDQYIE